MTRERNTASLLTGLLLLETEGGKSETRVTMLVSLLETREGDSGTESDAGYTKWEYLEIKTGQVCWRLERSLPHLRHFPAISESSLYFPTIP